MWSHVGKESASSIIKSELTGVFAVAEDPHKADQNKFSQQAVAND
jgi:hypothetical protein